MFLLSSSDNGFCVFAFAELGDLESAASVNEFQVIWNVPRGSSAYRPVAKEQGGRASIVYLLSLN